MYIALVWATYGSKIKVFQKWAMTHISWPPLVFENLKSRDVFIFDENNDDLQRNIQSFCFVFTKLEWRLKRHWPLEGYTFILAPRELNIYWVNRWHYELQVYKETYFLPHNNNRRRNLHFRTKGHSGHCELSIPLNRHKTMNNLLYCRADTLEYSNLNQH